MAEPTPEDATRLRFEVDALLMQLAEHPANLDVHQALRNAALRHKAAGGPDLGLFEKLKPHSRDPLRRMLTVERLLTFDPGNLDRMVELLECFAALDQSGGYGGFGPVRRWLEKILRKANGETGD